MEGLDPTKIRPGKLTITPDAVLDNMSALVERIETTGSMATGRPEIRFGPLGELVEATEGIPSGI